MKKHVVLVVAIFFLVISPAVSAQQKLFQGEVVLKIDGVYTHVYSYIHRETGKEVVLLGMLHHAEDTFFGHIQKILNSCEYVIFEKQDIRSDSDRVRVETENRKNLFGPNLDTAFWYALFSFPTRTSTRLLGLNHESAAFKYTKPNWVEGDELWYAEQVRTKWAPFFQKWYALAAVVSPEVKQEVVDSVRTFVRKVDLGVATKSDMVSLTIVPPFGIHGRILTPLALEAVGMERDEAAFRVFDQINLYNPKKICIKFGAGHMSYQRKLLERRGYQLEYVREYRAITIP